MFKIFAPTVFCFSAACMPMSAMAQKGIWDNPKKNVTVAKGKLDKGKGGLKKWKEHVEQWGMDNSYKHQFALGGKLNSNGWTGAAYYFKKTGSGKHDVWSLAFSEIKHEKQIKQQGKSGTYPNLDAPTPFVFGKINNLYTLQLGYSKQQLLLPGIVSGNLSVSFRYGGGVSLAMLKPYYLKLAYKDVYNPATDPVLKEEKYSEQNAETFLRTDKILGASKWGKSLGEMQYIPSAFAEASFVIEPSKSQWLAPTITLGAQGAYYSKALPIMANTKAQPWQANLFAGLSLGKRWK